MLKRGKSSKRLTDEEMNYLLMKKLRSQKMMRMKKKKKIMSLYNLFPDSKVSSTKLMS